MGGDVDSRVAKACGVATQLREDRIADKGNLAFGDAGKWISAT